MAIFKQYLNTFSLLSFLLLSVVMGGNAQAELVTDEGAVVIYRTADDFDMIKESVEMAITNRGMLVSSTLHVSDMLNRTGKDLGFDKAVYAKAESVEFCSALMSHRMTQIDPANLTICPFTVSVYVKSDEPEQVYVAFRKQTLIGEAETVTDSIHEMLHGIVKEAIDE